MPQDFRNYIEDNPKMARPPEFFLQRLYDQDSELVLLPSREHPYAYVLARRARRSYKALEAMVNMDLVKGDTAMCAHYGLVPVCLVHRNSGDGWDPDPIIRELRSRDIWAAGGGEKAADMLDQSDADWKAARRAENRDDMWMRSGDAWRSYQARTGQRTKLNQPQPRQKTAAKQSSPSGSTADSGNKIVLTDI